MADGTLHIREDEKMCSVVFLSESKTAARGLLSEKQEI